MSKLLPIEHSKSEVFILADRYAQECYMLTKKLPKEELFGITSQLRRAALSVPLNLVEGHARNSIKHRVNFSKISYGSLKEAQYLLYFIVEQQLLNDQEIEPVHKLGDKLAAVLWRKIASMNDSE